MRLEGTHLFAAPRATVWDALMDPTALAAALPGGEQLTPLGENQYRAVMNVKVGPVQGRFEGKIQLENVIAPDRYTIKVDGQGAPGFVAGEGELELSEPDSGGTLLRYGGDVTVGGRIAGVGQRLIESTAKSVTRQGLTALDLLIQARLQPAAPASGTDSADVPAVTFVPAGIGPAATAAPAPHPAGTPILDAATSAPPAAAPVSMATVGAQVLKDVTRDIAADYIPADKQEKVMYFSLGALAMLLFVILVRLVQKD
jgi:carbon monoxide dehydrogenase subunit G